MTKFRVLSGKHVQKEVTGKDHAGNPIVKQVMYSRGDIIETDVDLTRFNHSPQYRKFEKVEEKSNPAQLNVSVPSPVVPIVSASALNPVSSDVQTKTTVISNDKDYRAKLEKMNDKELRQHAQEEEVDLKGIVKREDIIKILCSQN